MVQRTIRRDDNSSRQLDALKTDLTDCLDHEKELLQIISKTDEQLLEAKLKTAALVSEIYDIKREKTNSWIKEHFGHGASWVSDYCALHARRGDLSKALAWGQKVLHRLANHRSTDRLVGLLRDYEHRENYDPTRHGREAKAKKTNFEDASEFDDRAGDQEDADGGSSARNAVGFSPQRASLEDQLAERDRQIKKLRAELSRNKKDFEDLRYPFNSRERYVFQCLRRKNKINMARLTGMSRRFGWRVKDVEEVYGKMLREKDAERSRRSSRNEQRPRTEPPSTTRRAEGRARSPKKKPRSRR
jgi:hypothetical protein